MYTNKELSRQCPDDRIYYNIAIPYNPDSTGFSPAIYKQSLTQPILYNPHEYYLAVVRFSIPTQNIPIFIAEIQPFPNVNLLNTIYSVTIQTSALNSSGQTFIQFITTTPNARQSAPLTPSHPIADKTAFYYVYEYTDFLKMINTALQTAFTNMPVKPPGSAAPYFIYDSTNEEISLVAQTAFYDINSPGHIEVYVNYPLLTFLDGIPTNFYGVGLANGLDFRFNIENLHNNFYNPPDIAPAIPPAYYIMNQNYHTLADWNSFKSLQIVSNLLPIKQEFIPDFNRLDQNTGVVNSQGILADFVPIINLGPEARTTVEFVLDGPYRAINLYSGIPITAVDIFIYWTDQFGNQYLLDIPFNQVATLKLVFIRKSTFTG